MILNMNGTDSALFVKALSQTQLFSVPALIATDFVFIEV